MALGAGPSCPLPSESALLPPAGPAGHRVTGNYPRLARASAHAGTHLDWVSLKTKQVFLALSIQSSFFPLKGDQR